MRMTQAGGQAANTGRAHATNSTLAGVTLVASRSLRRTEHT
jgi:hypothetical protein